MSQALAIPDCRPLSSILEDTRLPLHTGVQCVHTHIPHTRERIKVNTSSCKDENVKYTKHLEQCLALSRCSISGNCYFHILKEEITTFLTGNF